MDATDVIGHLTGRTIRMETELSHSHDQAIRIVKKVLDKANDEVDEQIEKSLLAGSPDIALRFGADLYATGQMRGVQLSRLLYMLDEMWDKWQTDDVVEDAVFKAMGISPKKFRQYRDVYRYVLKDHPVLSGKPWGGLLDIVTAAREEEFSEENWKELVAAHDRASMRAIREGVRGVVTKGHTRLSGWIDRDGYVWARIGNREQESAGFLQRGVAPDSAAGRLIQRILESAGIVQL